LLKARIDLFTHHRFHRKNGPSEKSGLPIIAESIFKINGQVKTIAKPKKKTNIVIRSHILGEYSGLFA
jgi:hypothetical protein